MRAHHKLTGQSGSSLLFRPNLAYFTSWTMRVTVGPWVGSPNTNSVIDVAWTTGSTQGIDELDMNPDGSYSIAELAGTPPTGEGYSPSGTVQQAQSYVIQMSHAGTTTTFSIDGRVVGTEQTHAGAQLFQVELSVDYRGPTSSTLSVTYRDFSLKPTG